MTLPADPLSLMLLTATAGALCWTVRTLWRMDRRIVRLETKAGFISNEESI